MDIPRDLDQINPSTICKMNFPFIKKLYVS